MSFKITRKTMHLRIWISYGSLNCTEDDLKRQWSGLKTRKTLKLTKKLKLRLMTNLMKMTLIIHQACRRWSLKKLL